VHPAAAVHAVSLALDEQGVEVPWHEWVRPASPDELCIPPEELEASVPAPPLLLPLLPP
jgi:hypothetical protein